MADVLVNRLHQLHDQRTVCDPMDGGDVDGLEAAPLRPRAGAGHAARVASKAWELLGWHRASALVSGARGPPRPMPPAPRAQRDSRRGRLVPAESGMGVELSLAVKDDRERTAHTEVDGLKSGLPARRVSPAAGPVDRKVGFLSISWRGVAWPRTTRRFHGYLIAATAGQHW